MKRIKTFLITATVGIFLIYAMIAVLAVEPKYITYQNYEVEQGDTLWNIAKAHMPNTDPRSVVFEIQQMNGLGNEFIQPGDVLKVPVVVETGSLMDGTLVAEEK